MSAAIAACRLARTGLPLGSGAEGTGVGGGGGRGLRPMPLKAPVALGELAQNDQKVGLPAAPASQRHSATPSLESAAP